MHPDQPSNAMIKVHWPKATINNDIEVCDWLGDLVADQPGEIIFEFRDPDELYFTREDDAIAFKLKFGL
jgi:hypothetical protein